MDNKSIKSIKSIKSTKSAKSARSARSSKSTEEQEVILPPTTLSDHDIEEQTNVDVSNEEVARESDPDVREHGPPTKGALKRATDAYHLTNEHTDSHDDLIEKDEKPPKKISISASATSEHRSPRKKKLFSADLTDRHALLYSVEEIPSWHTCVVLGLQHYLVAIGGLIGFPRLVAYEMCIQDNDEGFVVIGLLISNLFFVSGICTFIQTTIGIRLPILQGATFSFLPPINALLSLPHNVCPDPIDKNSSVYQLYGVDSSQTSLYNDTDGSIIQATELWQRRMREVQGSIAVASILQVVLGMSGAIGFILHYIGPLTIAPSIALIGLDLFSVAAYKASPQWGVAFFAASILIICSQYLGAYDVPFPSYSSRRKCHTTRAPLFKMFPVLFALFSGWILCLCLTAGGVFTNDSKKPEYYARTDVRKNVIFNSPWFYWPYPGQWGLPTVTPAGVIGTMAAVVAGFIESIGDYYACARVCRAPTPPKHAINRGVLMEGFGCILAGVIGTGTATTSFSENIGAIGITRVGSRRIMQVAGIVSIFLGIFSKFGSVFVTIPDPVLGGLFCVTAGMIAAVGVSNLQYVDMNSPRNLFITGTSLLMGLAVPGWMKQNPGAIATPVVEINQIITVLLQTPMLVGGGLAFFFDNTLPGTRDERGITAWKEGHSGGLIEDVEQVKAKEEKCYNMPFSTKSWPYARYLPFLPEFDPGRHHREVEDRVRRKSIATEEFRRRESAELEELRRRVSLQEENERRNSLDDTK